MWTNTCSNGGCTGWKHVISLVDGDNTRSLTYRKLLLAIRVPISDELVKMMTTERKAATQFMNTMNRIGARLSPCFTPQVEPKVAFSLPIRRSILALDWLTLTRNSSFGGREAAAAPLRILLAFIVRGPFVVRISSSGSACQGGFPMVFPIASTDDPRHKEAKYLRFWEQTSREEQNQWNLSP